MSENKKFFYSLVLVMDFGARDTASVSASRFQRVQLGSEHMDVYCELMLFIHKLKYLKCVQFFYHFLYGTYILFRVVIVFNFYKAYVLAEPVQLFYSVH